MARRSRMSILKRQRELHKAEKASRKRAKRLGLQIDGSTEPVPTIGAAEILGLKARAAGDSPDEPSENVDEQDGD